MTTAIVTPESACADSTLLVNEEPQEEPARLLPYYETCLQLGNLAGRRVMDYYKVERMRFVPRCANQEASRAVLGIGLVLDISFHDDASDQAIPGQMTVWETPSVASEQLLQQLESEVIPGPIWDRIKL